jgi:hypothetical protein
MTAKVQHRHICCIAVPFIFGLVLLCGCSKATKNVSVIASTWGTSEHQDCIFAHDSMYCIAPSMKTVLGRPVDIYKTKDGKPVPRTDMIFNLSANIVHAMEIMRADAHKDAHTEIGNYATSFSAAPVDYSLWDCSKTGSGSPAISCEMRKKPEGKAVDFFKNREADAAEDDFLRSLTPEVLAQKCSTPARATEDGISTSKFYKTTPGLPLSIRFDTIKSKVHPDIDEIETEEDLPKGQARHIFWWVSSNDTMSSAALIAKEFPCLQR